MRGNPTATAERGWGGDQTWILTCFFFLVDRIVDPCTFGILFFLLAFSFLKEGGERRDGGE